MNKFDIRCFSTAMFQAQLSDGMFKFGCVAAKKRTVVVAGRNRSKSHTIQKRYNAFRDFECKVDRLHAEMDVLIKCEKIITPKDFKNVELYIYRLDNQGNTCMARPCKACMNRIINLGIKTIHYTTPNGFCTEEITS